MLYAREAEGAFDDVVERIRQAVTDNKFSVMHEIDLRAALREKGFDFDRACRVLEICNPRQAKKALDTAPAVSAALPCRITVYEQDGCVKVATLEPKTMLGLFPDGEDLLEVASDVQVSILKIIDTSLEA